MNTTVSTHRRYIIHKRRTLRRLGRGLLGLLILLFTFAGIGALYQQIATARDRAAFPAPGQLVDVGGYRLHINCIGQGRPTVLLDAAGGNSSASWGLVQPEIARSTQVCAYDRAGMGWSERGPAPRDLQQYARELHTLLLNAHIGGPYVLVGHSYGGRIARVYAKQYPTEVVGIALLDPGRLDDDPRFPAPTRAEIESEARQIALARWLAPFGVVRALLPQPEYDDLPAQQQAANTSFNVTASFFETIADQYDALPQTYAQEREVRTLGALPLVVLSATAPNDQTRHVWTAMNGELAALSINSVHRIVDGSTHMGLVYSRRYAQQTIGAILDVVQAARSGQPLAGQ